ncbi:hypothetical protein IK146_00365 [Candidatus Saccharibacteria bacterium]|nr:hypothetical protein [Candidatus Saccharibacteria bacterium]
MEKQQKARYSMPSFFKFYESCGTHLYCGDWAVSDDMTGLCNGTAGYSVEEGNERDDHNRPLILRACKPGSWFVNEMKKHLAESMPCNIQVSPRLAVVFCLSGIITPSDFETMQENPDSVAFPGIKIDERVYTIIVTKGDFKNYRFVDCHEKIITG